MTRQSCRRGSSRLCQHGSERVNRVRAGASVPAVWHDPRRDAEPSVSQTDDTTASNRSPKRIILIVVAALVAVLALGYGAIFVYANVINDSPDKLDESDLSEALEATTTVAGDAAADTTPADTAPAGTAPPTPPPPTRARRHRFGRPSGRLRRRLVADRRIRVRLPRRGGARRREHHGGRAEQRDQRPHDDQRDDGSRRRHRGAGGQHHERRVAPRSASSPDGS